MSSWTASAPGKLILFGEHAVVYGHPAIATTVDLQTTVTLRERPGPSGTGSEDGRLQAALARVLPRNGIGVEIDSELADDIHRSVIREQVEMGVAVRMACLEALTADQVAGGSGR